MTNNPKNRQQWIFDLLKVEQLGFGEMFSKYLAMFGNISEVTFTKDWKKATQIHTEYLNKLNKAKEELSITKELEAVNNGLKLKIDRVLEKQANVDSIREAVKVGTTNDYYIFEGSVVEFVRALTEVEKATLLKRATEIETEISKIEADYAAIKTDSNITVQKLGAEASESYE